MEPVWEKSEYRQEHFRATHSADQGWNACRKEQGSLVALTSVRFKDLFYFRINIWAVLIAFKRVFLAVSRPHPGFSRALRLFTVR